MQKETLGSSPSKDQALSSQQSHSSEVDLLATSTFLGGIDAHPAIRSVQGASESDNSSRSSLGYGGTRAPAAQQRVETVSNSLTSADPSSSSASLDFQQQTLSRMELYDGQFIAEWDDKEGEDAEADAPENHGGMRSIGSMLHTAGQCRPCMFAMNMKDRCALGADCDFCHEYHKKKRSRPKNRTRPQGHGTGNRAAASSSADPSHSGSASTAQNYRRQIMRL